MADNDAQTELKKRARRRLVGASALALGAAIVLPMVMDREPKPSGSELQIRIPSQEGDNFASKAITGVAPTPVTPKPTATQSAVVQPPVQHLAQPAQVDAELGDVPAASAPRGDVTKPVDAEKPAHKESAKDASKERTSTRDSAKDSKETPKKTDVAKPAETDRARSILEGKEASAASKGSFFVQIGVYRDENNAKDVVAKAKGAGVKAGAEKAGDKTRVRSGPYAERSAAEAVVAKLKKAGVTGIVTAK